MGDVVHSILLLCGRAERRHRLHLESAATGCGRTTVTPRSILKSLTARPSEPSIDLDVNRHQRLVAGWIVLVEEVA
jgi:hypothetical protein